MNRRNNIYIDQVAGPALSLAAAQPALVAKVRGTVGQVGNSELSCETEWEGLRSISLELPTMTTP
jgi:hypothetical protein